MVIFFIVLFYCSIVLQSNLQPNYAYRQYAYKKRVYFIGVFKLSLRFFHEYIGVERERDQRSNEQQQFHRYCLWLSILRRISSF